jgi:hypothetical protein
MRVLRSKLTYANVIATLALFLALSGGVVWAAQKIGAKQLKANSVTAGKIKKNAVTTKKIKSKAVTNAKLANGAVNFAKIAAGTNVIATATGGPVAVNAVNTAISIPLTGTTAFTPVAGVVDQLNIEARGINLARTGVSTCSPLVQPLVNGQLFEVSSGSLALSSDTSVASEFNPVPLDSETGPVGLAQPGVPQQISMRVIGDTNCTAGSQVSVAIAVTQAK